MTHQLSKRGLLRGAFLVPLLAACSSGKSEAEGGPRQTDADRARDFLSDAITADPAGLYGFADIRVRDGQRIELLWKGSLPSGVADCIKTVRRRGVSVDVINASYSEIDLFEARSSILVDSSLMEGPGWKVVRVEQTRTCDALVVKVDADDRRKAPSQRTLEAAAGIPVEVEFL